MKNKIYGFKSEICFLNVLLCIFVVLIHLFTAEILKNNILFYIQKMMFFSIFGFVFLSAEKMFIQKTKTWYEYIKSCFKKIILPYIAAVTVYFIVLRILGYLNDTINTLPYYIVSGTLSAQFYFIPMIVQFYALLPALRRLINRFPAKHVISIAFVLNVLAVIFLYKYSFFNKLFVRYLFCYILGAYAGINYDKFINLIKKNVPAISAVYVFLQLIDFYNKLQIVHQLLTVVYMPSAILFYYMISLYITQKFRISENKIFRLIDSVTYQIYLWHILAIISADRISEVITANNITFILRVFAVTAYIAILIIRKRIKQGHSSVR